MRLYTCAEPDPHNRIVGVNRVAHFAVNELHSDQRSRHPMFSTFNRYY